MVVICGYSGHGLVVVETALAAGMQVHGYADKNVAGHNLFDLKYFGDERSDTFSGWSPDVDFILGIGNNMNRAQTGEMLKAREMNILNVFSPTAHISKHAQLGSGIFVAINAVINTLSSIGNGCIINTGSIVEHHCVIGQYSHIAPGAVLAGNVTVGDFTFIGANSIIKQGVSIGSNVTIGAGSVILNNIPDNQTVVGNPGRII